MMHDGKHDGKQMSVNELGRPIDDHKPNPEVAAAP